MPFKNQLNVDKLLSNVSVKYKNNELIGLDVFPKVSVKEDTDLYRIYERNFRVPDTLRADGALAREENFQVSTSSYTIEYHSLRNLVTDNQIRNFEQGQLLADTTEDLTDQIMRRVELSVADLFTLTNWSLNVSLAAADAKWNQDTVLSNPILVYDTAATEIIQQSGQKPNFGIIPRTSLIAIKNHQSVLDRIKYTSADVSQDMIKSLLGIDNLFVPTAVRDTADEGASGGSVIADIWPDNNFLGYKPATASPMAPSSGYTFMVNEPRVKRYREEAREGQWVEVGIKYVPKVIASLTGFLIRDTLA